MITDHDPGDELDAPVAAPPAAERLAITMARTACALAVRLGGPVYLVGSALTEPDPADVDVRVVLAAADLERLFGPRLVRGGRWWDWSEQDVRRGREQLKQSRRLSRRFGANVDLQIQTEDEARAYAGRPALRLDSIPAAAFAAGLGEA